MEIICRKPTEQRIKVDALHVEDDDIDARIIKVIAGMTEDLELSITRVRDLDQAREAIRDRHFDIYIVDLWLKGKMALDLVATLESRGRRAIILSNSTSHEAQIFRLSGDNTRFLCKGDCSPKAFADVVLAVLDSSLCDPEAANAGTSS